jgi:aspartyl-tRNA(Asn)/glutamyl-tRNA(Gln) amidotransferase subunit C
MSDTDASQPDDAAAATPSDAGASVDRTTVAETAYLARLSFDSEAEVEQLRADMQQMLGYVAALGEVDTEGVAVTIHAISEPNVFREDEPRPSLPRAQVLGLSPDADAAKEGFFGVPAVLGEGEAEGEEAPPE